MTRQTVLNHKNEKIGIEIIPASRRAYDVNPGRESREVWSFAPPDDAENWGARHPGRDSPRPR